MIDSIFSVEKEHLTECANIYLKIFNDKPWDDKWDLETAYKRLSDIYNTPNFEGTLYMDDGKVKGAVFGNYEQYYNGVHYYLREMFVLNESQGMGIGSKLLYNLEERLRSNDVTSVYLFTSNGNGTSYFYEKHGFCECSSMAMMGKRI